MHAITVLLLTVFIISSLLNILLCLRKFVRIFCKGVPSRNLGRYQTGKDLELYYGVGRLGTIRGLCLFLFFTKYFPRIFVANFYVRSNWNLGEISLEGEGRPPTSPLVLVLTSLNVRLHKSVSTTLCV